MVPMTVTALRLAEKFHYGQVDKSGRPYIEHVKRVASYMNSSTLQTVALLHDIIEDTSCTLDELRRYFIDDYIIDAVDAITRREKEYPVDYYARVRENTLALQVKVRDIFDNILPERLNKLDTPTRLRLKSKYINALQHLL